ncbi:hypothetical protein EJB05_41545 [Eragrostis curvula]|uniref:Uncharacterized protein n=1 Tax=Eragrostis curvula TaxID=38414 RepID=A0A5J9T9W9_9POAL|nr:hypothetical protein EJB05_41545 [Eragrostis curvula]
MLSCCIATFQLFQQIGESSGPVPRTSLSEPGAPAVCFKRCLSGSGGVNAEAPSPTLSEERQVVASAVGTWRPGQFLPRPLQDGPSSGWKIMLLSRSLREGGQPICLHPRASKNRIRSDEASHVTVQ